MKKPEILGIESQSYSDGRIDSFRIDESEGNWESIINCLVEFGFDDESIRSKIDMSLEHREYLFLYLNPKLRVHLSPERLKDFITIRFDTSIPREKIIDIFEKHFQFPK